MSFATDVKSDDFFKSANPQKVIEVRDDTTVTPSYDPDGTVGESDVKRYMVEGYTIKVDEGKNLVLKNLSMNNPVIQGNGNITLSVDEKSLINSKIGHYGNSLLVTGKGNDAVIEGKNINIINKSAASYNGDKNGIFMDAGSSRNLVMTADGKVSVSGAYHGIASEGGTSGAISIKAGSMDIKSKGWGIFMNGANKVDINVKNDFTINGGQGISNNGSKAITITSSDGNTAIKANQLYGATAGNGDVNITAKNNTVEVGDVNAVNYYAGIRSVRGSINVTATEGDNTITTGKNVSGIVSYLGKNGNAIVNAAKNNTITADLDGAYTEAGDIEVTAGNSNTITANRDGLSATGHHNTITLDAAKSNTVIAKQNVMYAADGGVIDVKSDEERSMMEGNVKAETGGIISADYNTGDSYLLGTVTTDDRRTDKSSTTLNFKNGGQWLVTGDSNVSNVDFSGGIINMTQTNKGNAHQVSIDTALNGSGTFIMDLKYLGNSVNTYKNASDSDFVYINGGDGSTQQLDFTPSGDNLGSMHTGDKLYFAETANGAAAFASNRITNVNQSGIYDQQFLINSEGASSTSKDWFITCLGNTVNPNGATPIASHHAGFALWRDDDTLLKRLGELRYSSPDEQVEDGIWARLIGKKLSYQHSDYGFVTHAKTLEVGYDKKKLTKDQKGTWWRGIALGHTWGRTDFNGGSGDNDFTDFKYYSTNIRQHDHYMDFVARIGRLDSDYDTNYGDHADYKNWAGSLSIEYGRKKKINKRNWYIEPQSQLTYSYIWGRDYTTKNGISVHQDDADSLVGRLGFVLSREFGDKRPDHNRLYLKASVLHEFLGNNNDYLDYNGTYLHDDMDFDGTWYILGAGFNADISNNCNFYFDIEKAYNSDIDLSYRVEGGFRWEW
ncbi:autotransporter outer membrane beta-barrel domain-containing protein [Megasphaera sp.]|uniref:autotransporter outer membrane beta-barrel domain-containing protein n=1 Tax=Megasphaera sp. TaxID=2023260 RepID=UPI0025C33C06|nr:autotransporter outer membrane beta-barrel domain-containing protein [Megasphaera sp.]MCF0153515.1 autotransporter outer membrane beta-barrel domain-containing protein [Megasphaera sp.]